MAVKLERLVVTLEAKVGKYEIDIKRAGASYEVPAKALAGAVASYETTGVPDNPNARRYEVKARDGRTWVGVVMAFTH